MNLIKAWWSNVRHCVCKMTGHWFSSTELFVFGIKTNARNRDMTATIKCKCCGETFVHKDAPNARQEQMKETAV